MITEAEREYFEFYMKKALRIAQAGAKSYSEVPVGAVVVQRNKIISAGYNHPIASKDPTTHAEIVAIRRACEKLGAYRIPEADLYVTLEPCIMCIGAIIHSRIHRLIYAASDPKVGVVSTGIYKILESDLNHRLEIYCGILMEESSLLLKSFFFQKR